MSKALLLFVTLSVSFFGTSSAFAADLSNWTDASSKQGIIKYVQEATREGSPSFVPVADRIAVFDNDGTLWAEKPFPPQFKFVLSRVYELSPKHPEWKSKQPFKAVLERDKKYLSQIDEKEIMTLFAATHAGMTQKVFEKEVKDWLKSAKDPTTGLLYTKQTYQPMVELLEYLRANEFETYVVTGGGTEFVRAFSEGAYGVRPEQVIGSNVQMTFQTKDGKPDLLRVAKVADPINLNDGKPINIQREIGKVPVIAAGNSDGDLQMLEYAEASGYPSLKILVHHDDSKREYAYDKGAEKVLKEAHAKKWTIVSMKNDFKKIYPTPPTQLGGEAGK